MVNSYESIMLEEKENVTIKITENLEEQKLNKIKKSHLCDFFELL